MTDEEIKKVFEIQRKIDEKRAKMAVFYQNLPKSAVFEIPSGKHGKSQISPVESTFLKIEQLEKEITRAEISAIKKLGLAKEVHAQKLKEAQDISEMVTLAKIKMGELLNELPKATPNNNKFHEIGTPAELVKTPKAEVIKEIGLNQTQAERLQIMAKNQDIVQASIAKAKDEGDCRE